MPNQADTRAVMLPSQLRSAICRPQRRRPALPGVQRPGRAIDRRPLPARSWWTTSAVRADLPGLCQRHRRCVRPQIPGLAPGGLGPHLTSSGFPCGLSSGFPLAHRVLPFRPPSSGSLRPAFSGCSLRPLPGSGSPSGFPFPRATFTLTLSRGRSAGVGPGRQGSRSPVLPRSPRSDRAIRPYYRRVAG